ncbi:unnamed protein product [Kluyveromyces dobzhanskii CBS 2104]|uniref:Trimethyllysine dioxygenase n=1 Tax=Kluyveromyces dobzhanskii CBS 2104 TaxID=1427455 RepID=A0A0A8KZ35_9SACH|nr:unnamed protein product [Kluyveromyces dobzhanskii CBS 2104]
MSIEIVDSVEDKSFDNYVTIKLDDSLYLFHLVYLRDNCTSEKSFHEETNQRLIDVFNDIDLETDLNGTPSVEGNELVVKWHDGHISRFTVKWLLNHAYYPSKNIVKNETIKFPSRISWDKTRFCELKQSKDHFKNDYNHIHDDIVKRNIFHEIYQYGFTFIENVPVSIEATKEVSEIISIIRPTHYDTGVWDFTSDLSKKDTAYTSLAIDMHTDGNYWFETPGLQLFHLLMHDGQGGETRICDVAHVLKLIQEKASKDESWQETLEILTNQPIEFHQSGESENVFFENRYPILQIDENGELIQCRWNTSDRTSMLKNNKFSVNEIYRAMARFNDLINDSSNSVRFPLAPGTILVFDNWRVLHARTAFNGKRRLCGSYLTRDDFIARFRSLVFKREQWLESV